MSRFRLVAFLFAVAAVSEIVAADTPEAVAAIAKRYEAEVAKLQAEHVNAVTEQRKALTAATTAAKKAYEQTVADAAGLYGKELDRLAAKAKDAGDLDAVLTLKAERDKLTDAGVSGKAGKLPAEAAKARTACETATSKAKLAFEAAVAKSRKEFEAAERGLVQKFTAAARETHAAHLRELLDIEKSETKDGKIDSAVAIRSFRTQIEKSGPPLPEGDGSAGGAAFASRTGAAKAKLLAKYGGNAESEAAVARGLAYLARQQKQDGSWVFDGASKGDTIAATGMSLLPFLAAGESHQGGKKYRQTVLRGLQYLISQQRADGSFKGTTLTMYSHGIATIALNDAYGMTKDRALLLRPAQAATNFIVTKQGADGSWGYAPGANGDTSIVGWQVQALKAAMLSKDIVVPAKAITNVLSFLDKVSSGSGKAVYGYATPNGAPGTSLSAIGLLCRHHIGKWAPGHAGLSEGVDGLQKRPPAQAPALPDMYFYYYATQVVHCEDDEDWKTWNEGRTINGKRQGGMRDWLVSLQEKKEGPNQGSWASDGAIIGGSCGRIGTTALSLLTLEVYYRYMPVNDGSR
jgi:hypothetical protein